MSSEPRAVVVFPQVRRIEEEEGVGGIIFGDCVLKGLLKNVGPLKQGHILRIG